jgi:putative addiction module killer protein
VRARNETKRRLLADDIDPGTQRKQEEHQRRVAQLRTFEAVAREWLTKQSWGESHGARNTRRLEQHVFPCVGSLGVSSIKRAQIKEVLHRIEKIGHIETAFAQHANTVVILLCGGDKRTQAKDIEQAHAYWKDYKAQNRT